MRAVPRGVHDAGANASACDVATNVVLENHPDVFFLRITFGVFFEGESSAVANGGALAATLGVAATERDAFAYVLRKDVASTFGVSASETISRKIAIPALGVDDAERKGEEERSCALTLPVGSSSSPSSRGGRARANPRAWRRRRWRCWCRRPRRRRRA